MQASGAPGRVFTIPTGAPFLQTFVEALLSGAVIPGFPDKARPLDLATATIFVPTQRAAAALSRTFLRLGGRGAALLPKIAPLGRLEDLEPDALTDDSEDALAIEERDAVSDLERRLVLARLIRSWAQKLRHAIVSVGPDGRIETNADEPILIGSSFASAWTLAADLSALIDEFIIEGIEWSELKALVPDEFDRFWAITREFLTIVAERWPQHLAERGLVDRAAGQTARVDREIARIEARSSGPMLVVGSTGANAATARLIAAIAARPRGAVVLPGLDRELDEKSWALLSLADGGGGTVSHPQAAMARLLTAMRVVRRDVVALGRRADWASARARFLSAAMRPAETTDLWRDLRVSGAPGALSKGLEGVAVIEASDERQEALSIAIALREALQRGERAALMTPDRDIARRVRAQLRRWDVDVDDSAGESLGRTPWGAHARLLLDAAVGDGGAVDAMALLSHPMTRLGFDGERRERLARLADLGVFRNVVDVSLDATELVANARAQSEARGAHRNSRLIGEADWEALTALLTAYQASLAPLRSRDRVAAIDVWAALHSQAINDSTAGCDAPQPGDGHAELRSVLAEMALHGGFGERLDIRDYRTLFGRVLGGTAVRPRAAGPRNLQILGLLEARLLSFDMVVLAGLDEGVWPPKTQTDAFLNRSMRLQLGLPAPDRRIGQTAHDFVQMFSAPKVMLARAMKRDGTPTVPSRFVQRLAAFAGQEQWSLCLRRGAHYPVWARKLDARERAIVQPPAPRPAADLQPTVLSVTRIETLRRDPYSIYAERILELAPIEPLGPSLGGRDYGVALHDAIAAFARRLHARSGEADIAALIAETRARLSAFFGDVEFEQFTWPRLMRTLERYYAWEEERAVTLRSVQLEQPGSLKLRLQDGSAFALTARADRIETDVEGCVCVVDFKTGGVPSEPEIAAGFAPQLVLEAAMAKARAFGNPQPKSVSALYVKLGGAAEFCTQEVGKKRTLDELAAEQLQGVQALLSELRLGQKPFLSRPFPQFASRYGQYDHLARVKEWSASDADGEIA